MKLLKGVGVQRGSCDKLMMVMVKNGNESDDEEAD